MEKNNQPLIITAIIGGIVLIIALALIFTRNNDSEPETNNQTDTTETESENNGSENGVNEGGENGNNGQQPDPTPTPSPTPDPQPTPTPTPDPEPQPGGLPDNWNSLTAREKTDLNPFDCDHEAQIIWAEDGSCHDKSETLPVEFSKSSFLRFDSFASYSNPRSIRCNFYYPSEDDPENDDFVWDDCGFTLRFQATADINDLTDLPDQSYLYRTGKTNSSGEACLALNLDFLKFTFGEGEGATTESYASSISESRHPSSSCQISQRGGLSFTEMEEGEFYDIRFYILNKTTAEMKQKISVTIQADPQVILDEMTADLAGGQSPVE